MPRVVFSYPEVGGAVGLTEEQAKELFNINVQKNLFFKPNGKAIIDGAGEGFVKVISDADSGVILGACVVGKSATELVHEFVPLVKKNRMTVGDLAGCVHGHPTLSEVVWETVIS